MTRRCARLRCPSFAARQAGPWRRKTSATSSRGRSTPAQAGAGVLRFSSSSGLWTWPMVLRATRAYRVVEAMCRWPSRPWMTRMSTPCSSRWVAQRVHGDRLVEPGGLDRLAARPLHRARRDRPGRVGAGEQPRAGAGAGAAPVGAQDREQLRREHDVAVAAALALADADRHPGAVDVGHLE